MVMIWQKRFDWQAKCGVVAAAVAVVVVVVGGGARHTEVEMLFVQNLHTLHR